MLDLNGVAHDPAPTSPALSLAPQSRASSASMPSRAPTSEYRPMLTLAKPPPAVFLSLVLCACSAVPLPHGDRPTSSEQAPQESADYAQLARGEGRVFRFDPAASRIRIYVYRGGSAPRVGHNHVVYPARFNAQAFLPAQGMSQARLDLEFRLDELELDAPAERAALGPAFAAVIDRDSIASTR